ncbi:ribosomal maturation YjgA family protein [Xanthomonas arboricola]
MALGVRCTYLLIAFAVFVIEVAIGAGTLGGPWVRGSLGDVLAVILVYCGLRGVLALPPRWACVLAVTIGCLIEGLQALHLADRLGLRPGSAAYIALGNTATVHDLLMYLVGGGAAYIGDMASCRVAASSQR